MKDTKGPNGPSGPSGPGGPGGPVEIGGVSDKPAAGTEGPEELRRQIEETRTQLGDTVEELAAKADVKGRAKARGAELKDRASEAGHSVQGKAVRAGHVVQERVPQPVRHAATAVVQAGLRNPKPVLIAGAGVVVAAGVLRRRRNGRG
ncbi:DUF3618 domain-containing protein [Streptomyces sp. BH-SS-21]|uniref:DUF3618 domain-containing protein n=1 Tax=Streptomyces liliiviolaceus TaxID=2823109 RepID=A0A940XUN0_9ACTN|nr:DUF3618 domain-containing protein [Streptomyces liliiviolaceus]MBQ0849923.1 DUF3618 domain-containing protein [Streptomyces liliiviolaceus]